MRTFKNLPLAIYNKFSKLCKLAYKGIVSTRNHVRLIFTGLPSVLDWWTATLSLRCTWRREQSHHTTSYIYFAAVHVSSLSSAEQLELFRRNKEGRWKIVLRFLISLTCFSKENVLPPPPGEVISSYSVPVDVDTDLVNWLFEAQSTDALN